MIVEITPIMIQPRTSVMQFVDDVVRAERALSQAKSSGDVTQRLVGRLRRQLVRLVGSDGFDVLLARALVLTKRAYPALAAVTIDQDGTFVGFEEARDDAGFDGPVVIIAHFVELL